MFLPSIGAQTKPGLPGMLNGAVWEHGTPYLTELDMVRGGFFGSLTRYGRGRIVNF